MLVQSKDDVIVTASNFSSERYGAGSSPFWAGTEMDEIDSSGLSTGLPGQQCCPGAMSGDSDSEMLASLRLESPLRLQCPYL